MFQMNLLLQNCLYNTRVPGSYCLITSPLRSEDCWFRTHSCESTGEEVGDDVVGTIKSNREFKLWPYSNCAGEEPVELCCELRY